ncbi:hypothetical protein LTR78_000290 [Recurvomyces mirabilis]|uniref:Uncharacterized protein n=1 Tax=Recurvomyces mirabilis TaxID=574656 RepID=A0AAE0WXR9_9PEZI|nr:hypothetical protein LTR78_000290 [Recurvomyces mirabilis]KAK5161945.1 hypothetical protein LTS14_000291 [Recurvomyces mirabilis]
MDHATDGYTADTTPSPDTHGWGDDNKSVVWGTHGGFGNAGTTLPLTAAQKRRRIKSRPVPLSLQTPEEISRVCVEKPVILGQKNARYGLQHPVKIQKPHPYDAIFHYSVPGMQEYNSQSFTRTADPLLIEALPISPTLFYACDTTAAVHCLVRHDFIALVQLKLVCDLDGGWNAATVMVRDQDRWLSLSSFLSALPEPSIRTVGPSGFKLQWIWWSRMPGEKRAKFQYNKLPVEIQQHIMLYALGKRVLFKAPLDPRRTLVQTISQGSGTDSEPAVLYDSTRPADVPQSNLSLLRLDKRTHAMAMSTLLKDTIKVYEHLIFAQASMITSHFDPTDLRYLELRFTYREYILFFGVEVRPWDDIGAHHNAVVPASMLKTLPNLVQLNLFFPSTASCYYSPWAGYDDQPQYLLRQDVIPSPCQKVLLDWILTFAIEHLLGIRKVLFTGYIKTETRKKWEWVLANQTEIDVAGMFNEHKESIKKLSPAAAFDEVRKLSDFYHEEKQRRAYKAAFAKYWFDFSDDGKTESNSQVEVNSSAEERSIATGSG